MSAQTGSSTPGGVLRCARVAALLVLGVSALVVGAQQARPAPSDAFRSHIVGVRRIQFTRRPPPPAATQASTMVGGGGGRGVRGGGAGRSGVAPMGASHAGESARAEVGGAKTGSEQAPTREQLELYWNYRRMLLQRERERLLHRLPAAGEAGTRKVKVGGGGGGSGSSSSNTTAALRNSTTSAAQQGNRNCTEYSLSEGSPPVKLCDEVHLLNYTDDVNRPPQADTTAASPTGSAMTEAEARRALLSGGGQMNGRDWMGRERYKQARLFMIQARILQKLGIQRQPHFSDMDLTETDRSRIMTAFRIYESELGTDLLDEGAGYIKTLGLLTPSCNLPRNTNEAWWDGSRFRLYFQTQSPLWRNTKIFSATLRIYKRAMENCGSCYLRASDPVDHQVVRAERRRRQKSTQEVEGSQDGNQHPMEEAETTADTPEPEVQTIPEDSIKVTVYLYTKSVKTRRKEKVLELDSALLRRADEGWVKFEIKDAIANWYHGSQRNFGLQVRVTDHQRRELDPFSILVSTNCSLTNNTTLSPAPPMRGGELSVDGLNGTEIDTNQTTPYLDLVMIDLPRNQRVQVQQFRPIIRHRRRATPRMRANSPLPNPNAQQNKDDQVYQHRLSSFLRRLSEDVMKSNTQIAEQSTSKAQQS